MKRFVSIFAVLAILALGMMLPACNTSRGFGADVEKAGASMKNSAEKHGAD